MPSQQNATGCLPKMPNLPQMPQQEESFNFSCLLQVAGLTLIPIATSAGSWLLFHPSHEQMRWQQWLKKPQFSLVDSDISGLVEMCSLLTAGLSFACLIWDSPAGSLKSMACVLFGVTMVTTVGTTYVYNKVKILEYWAAAAALMFVSTAVTNCVFFCVDQEIGWFLFSMTSWRACQMLDIGAIYLLQRGGDEKKKQIPREPKRKTRKN